MLVLQLQLLLLLLQGVLLARKIQLVFCICYSFPFLTVSKSRRKSSMIGTECLQCYCYCHLLQLTKIRVHNTHTQQQVLCLQCLKYKFSQITTHNSFLHFLEFEIHTTHSFLSSFPLSCACLLIAVRLL